MPATPPANRKYIFIVSWTTRDILHPGHTLGQGGVAVSDKLAAEVISLPMHAYLDAPTQALIPGQRISARRAETNPHRMHTDQPRITV